MTEERQLELLQNTMEALTKYSPKNAGCITWIMQMTGITAEEIKEINPPPKEKTKPTLLEEIKSVIDFFNLKDEKYNWSATIQNNVVYISWGGLNCGDYFSVINNGELYNVFTSKGRRLNIGTKGLKTTLFNLFSYCKKEETL